jgi:hypothetical protein
MDFLKKHYEKVLLGAVLIGLVFAVTFLLFKINGDKEELERMRNEVIRPPVKPLTNLDLSLPKEALKRMAEPVALDFSTPNKLFNPLTWQKAPDGRLVPGTKVGPSALTITNLTPLYLRLNLESVSTSEAGARYVIGVQQEAAVRPEKRNKRMAYCKLNDKTDTFTLVEVKGPADDPTELRVVLNDTGKTNVITKTQPYQRVDGYMADLRYEVERRGWNKYRVGSPLSFGGEDYKIVAINENEVILLANSNQKKWTITYTKPNAAP